MTDQEFEILDELYFLSSFDALLQKIDFPEDVLQKELKSLLERGWVKLLDIDTEAEIDELKEFDLNYKKYNYLVSKAGLLAHNSR